MPGLRLVGKSEEIIRLKLSQSPETWRKPVLKKDENFLTLKLFDLDWRLALSHRNAMRHPRSGPLSM